MKRYAWLVSTLLVILLLLAGCSIPALTTPSAAPPAAPATAGTSAPRTKPEVVASLEATLERIYEQVNPSVVNIQVVHKEQVLVPTIPEVPGFPFFGPREFQGPQEFFRRGMGSGFVWDKEGHIVTNNHVVEGADKVTVTFYDGTTVPATIVGTDRNSDLAVVKVDVPAGRLRPVQIADSTQVKVGELVVAIGNPFGLQGTMTVGFVSALGRLLPVESAMPGQRYTIPDIIQTDAPINPGNSGGVLVDDQGRLIGVTAAIESPVQANVGIGFAIPSIIVQKVVPALIKTGHYEHPWLGIAGLSLTPEVAQAMDLKPDQRGVLVQVVTPDSPADKAGLRSSDRQVTIEGEQVRVGGDVIIAIDDQPVRGFDDLVTYLARYTEVGQKVTLTILRQGKEQEVEVTLAARPATSPEQPGRQEEARGARRAWLGILGTAVIPEIAEAMNLPPDQQGVLIEQVVSGSPADKAGLRGSYKPVVIGGRQLLVGGDIIVALDDHPVTGMQDLLELLYQAEPGQEVTLTLLRGGERTEVTVTLGERPESLP